MERQKRTEVIYRRRHIKRKRERVKDMYMQLERDKDRDGGSQEEIYIIPETSV